MATNGAMFYYFKRSGTYYAEGKGTASKDVWHGCFGAEERMAALLSENGGKMPGLSGSSKEFKTVVIPDEDHDGGWPLHFDPEI